MAGETSSTCSVWGTLLAQAPMSPSSFTKNTSLLLTESENSLSGLAGVVQLVEHRPVHQKVAALIPGQGTYPGY